MEMVQVRTHAGAYPVHIGTGILANTGNLLLRQMSPCKAAVVTDINVAPLYLNIVLESLQNAGFAPVSIVFPAGEGSKSMETLERVLDFFAAQQLTRTDLAVALGGGVVGDLTGFAAGVFLRGLPFVQLPTTLLAAVDSSVGGKTAVNLSAGKNLAGVFWQPKAVICDVDTLATLPPEQFACGAAESIKYGVLADTDLFMQFTHGITKDNLPNIIARCVALKADIVERDELDVGERQLLNLGHTLGHAVEQCSGFTIPHGQAVAMGMVLIARASEALGMGENGVANAIQQVLTANGLPTETDFDVKSLLHAALSDKKRTGGTITLVVPQKIGVCMLHKIPVAELEAWIRLGKGASK